MNRDEWKTLGRHLRTMLRDRPEIEACSKSLMHNGIEWTARLCRCRNCKGPANIMPSMIRQRPVAMRLADEWRWIVLDRKLALQQRYNRALDRRAYRGGIAYLRDLRTA
jgi:hypothetical protein